MLVRQSRIFLTNTDLRDLEVLLRRRGDTQFLSDATNSANDALLPLATLEMAPERGQRQSPICYLAPAAGTPKVKLEVHSAVKTSVALYDSEVVELWRCHVSADGIGHGNLSYSARYTSPGGDLYEKSPSFVSWAEKVVSAIKRSLTFDKALLAYVGTDAGPKIASGELKIIPLA